jgi:hypothetical protein
MNSTVEKPTDVIKMKIESYSISAPNTDLEQTNKRDPLILSDTEIGPIQSINRVQYVSNKPSNAEAFGRKSSQADKPVKTEDYGQESNLVNPIELPIKPYCTEDIGSEDHSKSENAPILEENTSLPNYTKSLSHSGKQSKNSKIDFYKIENDNNSKNGYVSNNVKQYEKCNAVKDNFISSKNALDFIIVGLKNDLRVRQFKIIRDAIYIYFWTINDSISFYRQHFKLTELSFAYKYDFQKDFLFGQSEILVDFNLSAEKPITKVDQAKDFQVCPPEKAVVVTFDKLKSSFSENLRANNSHLKIKPYELTDKYKRTSDKPMQMLDVKMSNINSEKIAGYSGEKMKIICTTDKKHFSSQILSSERNSTIFKLKNKSLSAQREEFEARVEYFNKMKNFYSKKDAKKMEDLYEAGAREFLFLNSKELSVGSYSNVIMQNAVRSMTAEELHNIVKNLSYDIVPISATKHGAYTIQTIILSASSKATQNLISCYFESNGGFLISHEIGNYSIQKVLRFDPEIVFDLCMTNIEDIISNELGFKVFKRCLEFFKAKKEVIFENLTMIESHENQEKCKSIIQILNE